MVETMYALFFLAIVAILLVFFNPLLIGLICVFRRSSPPPRRAGDLPTVDIIIAVRNGAGAIGRKISSCLALDYPGSKLKVIVVSDGSTDGTVEEALAVGSDRLTVEELPAHAGKNLALNHALRFGTGEVLVFSDVDAEISPDAVRLLVRHFSVPEIGGVSGNKVIRSSDRSLGGPQSRYNSFATLIKVLESRTGSVSSSDGTLYAIRRSLYRPIPPGVTDDLFLCLSVITEGHRFSFEPDARALIAPPARDVAHEISRRRRIVSNSLKGLVMMKAALNPAAFGVVAVSLWCNKVLRRLLPFFLLALLFTSTALATRSTLAALALAGQAAFYLAAFLHLLTGAGGRFAALASFFVAASAGTFLGVLDFIRGREIVKWDPESL